MAGGQPTKYNKDIAERLTELLSHMTLDKAVVVVGISEQTYYNWLYKHDQFFELSKKARLTKGIHHFTEAQKVLDETREARKSQDEGFRSDLARLELDFHLRLAGKANQGLFGDPKKEDATTKEPIIMNVNLTKEKE